MSTYSGRVNNGTMLSGWSLVKTYLILTVSQGVLDSLKFYSFNSHAPAEVLCDDTFLVSTALCYRFRFRTGRFFLIWNELLDFSNLKLKCA